MRRGFIYYFGKEKTLIKRHREDNPINILFTSLINNYSAVQAAAKASGGGEI